MNKTQEQLVHKMHSRVNGGAIEAEYKLIALQGADGLHIAKRYEGAEDYRQFDLDTSAEIIDSYSADVKGLLEIIDHLKNERDQYRQDYNNFINEAWQIAREGTMGEWDYPVQVLRHLRERVAELKGEKKPINLTK